MPIGFETAVKDEKTTTHAHSPKRRVIVVMSFLAVIIALTILVNMFTSGGSTPESPPAPVTPTGQVVDPSTNELTTQGDSASVTYHAGKGGVTDSRCYLTFEGMTVAKTMHSVFVHWYILGEPAEVGFTTVATNSPIGFGEKQSLTAESPVPVPDGKMICEVTEVM